MQKGTERNSRGFSAERENSEAQYAQFKEWRQRKRNNMWCPGLLTLIKTLLVIVVLGYSCVALYLCVDAYRSGKDLVTVLLIGTANSTAVCLAAARTAADWMAAKGTELWCQMPLVECTDMSHLPSTVKMQAILQLRFPEIASIVKAEELAEDIRSSLKAMKHEDDVAVMQSVKVALRDMKKPIVLCKTLQKDTVKSVAHFTRALLSNIEVRGDTAIVTAAANQQWLYGAAALSNFTSEAESRLDEIIATLNEVRNQIEGVKDRVAEKKHHNDLSRCRYRLYRYFSDKCTIFKMLDDTSNLIKEEWNSVTTAHTELSIAAGVLAARQIQITGLPATVPSQFIAEMKQIATDD